MLFGIVLQIIISIIIVFILHQIFIYLQENYSVRKVKDVSLQAEKYKRIIEDLTKQQIKQATAVDDYELMKQDLEQFLPQIGVS